MTNDVTVHDETTARGPSPNVPHHRMAPLLPQTFAEVEHMANVMASAKLVPPHFQKSPGDCILLIRLAQHWLMDPFMLAQECYCISGKLMPSGKLAAAVINTNGNLAERLRYEYSGEGESRVITVIGRFVNEAEPRAVDVKFKDAKTANEQWKKQPDQQLMYAGARTWGRRHVPELMLGVTFVEEADAMPVQPPRQFSALPKIQSAPPISTAQTDLIDPQTGEVLEQEHAAPFTIEMNEGSTWAQFLEPLQRHINSAASIEEIDEWLLKNQDMLLKLREAKPQLYRLFEKNVEPRKLELTQ